MGSYQYRGGREGTRYNRKSVVMVAIEKAKTGSMQVDPSHWKRGVRSPGLKKAGLNSISSHLAL